MAISRSVPSVRRRTSFPATNTGGLVGMRHIVLFVCLTLCRLLSFFGGKVFRGRFRRSTKRSMVGQVQARFDVTQHAHFGRRSSHFFLRCRHVRQPVFVRNDACEVGGDFIMDWNMRTLARIRSVLISYLRPMYATCSMHVICSAERIAEDESCRQIRPDCYTLHLAIGPETWSCGVRGN
jgi:hypothetical protein